MASKRPPIFAGDRLEIRNDTGDPFRTELTLDGEPLVSVVRLKLDVQVEQGVATVYEQGQFAALPVEVQFANPRFRLIADPVFPQYVDAEIRAALAATLLDLLDERLDLWSAGDSETRSAAAILVGDALEELVPVAAARVSRLFDRPISPDQMAVMRQSPANEVGENGISRNGTTETGERAGSDD